MTLAPELVADGLVNLFGAGGALVVAAEYHRADPRGPVSRRIVFALRFVGVLFLVRALAWSTRSGLALTLVDWLASATPLVSLIVAEGLLRRHAPRWLKLGLCIGPALGLCIGPALVVICSLAPFLPPASRPLLLLADVVIGFSAVGLFLLFRNRGSLTPAENTTIRRLLIAFLFLAPMTVTDFRSIWPEIPVRLGAVGALIVLYVGFGSGNVQSSIAARLGDLGIFLAIAAVIAAGYVATGAFLATAHHIQISAVGFCGMIAAALFAEARGARAESNRMVAPLIEATSPAAFLDCLRRHPVIGDIHVLEGTALDHVRHPAFQALLAAHPVVSRAASPWGRPAEDEGVERALSLMSAHDATHLMLLTHEPLRIIAFAVPPIAASARTDGEIQIARRIGQLVYAGEAAL
jgi:hypothetical protein